MATISRRKFMGGVGASVLAHYSVPPLFAQSTMSHQMLDAVDCGVASGEPTADSVILWTRVPPIARSLGQTTELEWEVATAPTFAHDTMVQTGVVLTDSRRDWTVKVKVKTLNPATFYWYRFRAGNDWSSVAGRTKTLPAANADLKRVQFAVISCQDFSIGFYNAFDQLAKESVDFIVHLGDAIYAEGRERNQRGAVRSDLIGGGAAQSLAEYRAKYLLYLTDPAWREVRRLFPLFVIHDDHEIWNNYPLHADVQGGRVASALRAYREYAVTELEPEDYAMPSTWRSIRLGGLADIFAMDLRKARNSSPCDATRGTWGCRDTWSRERTMLGPVQKRWVLNELGASKARWKILLNEVMMTPFRIQATSWLTQELLSVVLGSNASSYRDYLVSGDSWDGFPIERQQITQFIYNHKIQGVLSLAGDVHNFFAGSLHLDPYDVKSPIVGHEIVGGSITSNGIEDLVGSTMSNILFSVVRSHNPHLQFIDLKYHGYMRVTLAPEKAISEFIVVDSVKKRSAQAMKLGTISVASNGLTTY